MGKYEEMKKKLICGWNTWNTRSVLSHVLLPEGFAINLCFKEHATGTFWCDHYLKEALIGRAGGHEEKIHPGPHAYDGSYTKLNLQWRGMEAIIESAVHEDELVLRIIPVKNQKYPVTLVAEAGMLWNRKGAISLEEGMLKAQLPGRTVTVYATKSLIEEFNVPSQTPYMAMDMDGPVGISTGVRRNLDEIDRIIAANRDKHNKTLEEYGRLAEGYEALQSCVAWDTIYEPRKDRVVTPVSRIWNNIWGGYVLFCWDTYFAAWLAMPGYKELAYANAIEITREKTERGFVPNYAGDPDCKSRDRSQPPVGAMTVWALYRRFKEKWLLEELFDDLYQWNQWWLENRMAEEGLLAWGSNPFEPVFGGLSEIDGVGDRLGAALESGLDNSPMYDDIPFNAQKQCLELADVGLTGLYIADCEALADIAEAIGRPKEAAELRACAGRFSKGLLELWDEQSGMFLNKRTDTGEFAHRLSPTNFYALFGSGITEEQKDRMLKEHFYNPEEFWGEWVLPSIARNDPACREQFYWRGRVWAPMNFLVYLAMKKQGMKAACKDLAEKSLRLLLKEWREHGHIHENYNADTGEGCDSRNSDRFYHWGALLSLIALMDSNGDFLF